MKITNFKRMIKEDFEKEYQGLIDKISFIINPMGEQLVAALDHSIDFDNLNQQFTQTTVTVGSNGSPTPSLEIKYTLKTPEIQEIDLTVTVTELVGEFSNPARGDKLPRLSFRWTCCIPLTGDPAAGMTGYLITYRARGRAGDTGSRCISRWQEGVQSAQAVTGPCR